MIQLTQVKMPVTHRPEELRARAARLLRIRESDIKSLRIIRRSVDARDKSSLSYVYSLALECSREREAIRSSRSRNASIWQPSSYHFPEPGEKPMDFSPVIVGSGPCGLWCAYELALHGYHPILLERGEPAHIRQRQIEEFWETGRLDTESNVQFGEGGAGTFSDGKLNTGVRDRAGRNYEVLRILTRMGAPEDILFEARPHLGTDLLVHIVKTLREEIIRLGGTVHFGTKVTDLVIRDQSVCGVICGDGRVFDTEAVVLAIGHSARDTFEMLAKKPLRMEEKSFALGLRIMHPQDLIDRALYGEGAPTFLGPSSYHLAHNFPDGRGVYSFCMCPGGYVVNASSEEGRLAVNGMSYHKRDSGVANSAIIATVGPGDFAPFHREGTAEVLSGMEMQRELERRAFELASGKIPMQTLADFEQGRGGSLPGFEPRVCGQAGYAPVHTLLQPHIRTAISEALHHFGQKIEGFDMPDALFCGVETRTSSPVRITRDRFFQSSLSGLYPAGEGAGYAGGITSAAMDGMKVAEEIARRYRPT